MKLVALLQLGSSTKKLLESTHRSTGHRYLMLPRLKVQDIKVILENQVPGAELRSRGGSSMQATDCRQRGFTLEFRVPRSKRSPSAGSEGGDEHHDCH